MSWDEPGETPATEGDERAFRQFEEWIHATADAQNQTPEEVTERLIYSYWLFTELADVVDNIRKQSVRQGKTNWPTDPPSGSLIDTLGHPSVAGSDTESNSTDPGTEESSEKSGDSPGRVSGEQSGDRPRMADIERLCDELQGLTGSVEQNSADLAESVRREEFEELADRVDTEQARHEQLTARVEREFDGIEAAIEELLTLLDETEARFDQELSETSRAVTLHEEFIERREQLADLRQAAIEQGVMSAVCEDCGTSVPLAMLDRPECPGCSARFDGLAESGWNPFRSPRLETASEPQDGTGPSATGGER